MDLLAALAATRFGTGLSPVHPAPRGAADLLAALDGPDRVAATLPQPGWAERSGLTREVVRLRRAARAGEAGAREEADRLTRVNRRAQMEDVTRMVVRGVVTPDGFRERLAWFWADHFTVMGKGGQARGTVSAYHEEALRPHLAGRFADLLRSAVTHPTMLYYLDQMMSFGPSSRRGLNSGRGLNENLAREVLELHTLGAGGPYTQTDVRQLAELLTGLVVSGDGGFRFDRRRAEPGAETVLGRSYGGDGEARLADVEAVLADLAAHPATALHLCRKLAVHFVADAPPEPLVGAMVAAWRATGGDLRAVYGAMLDHPAAWSSERPKVRRPIEHLAAGLRALGRGTELMEMDRRTAQRVIGRPLIEMGQQIERPPGPQGWPEAAEAWATPQNFAARLDWAGRAPAWTGEIPDPRALAEVALGPLLTPRTRFAAEAAESRRVGVALVLSSPEFLRR